MPAFLITLPLVTALIMLPLGRWPRIVTGVGVGVALGTAALAASAISGEGPVGASWIVLGRVFELTPFSALFLAFLAGGLAFLFALRWLSPGPASLVPGGLAALGFLAAAHMIRPFSFGAFFLLAATAMVVPSLYGGRFDSASSTWVAFLAVAVSMPLLIAAGWLLDSGQAQGDAAHMVLLLASLLILGGFPFYVWITGVAREAPLPALALYIGIVGAGVAVWLAQVLDAFPVARGSVIFETAALGSVLLSSLVAAFGLSRAADWRAWLAYVLVFDAGMQVAALALPGATSIAVIAAGTLGRLLGLLLLVGVASSASRVQGKAAVWRRILWALAGLTLLGLPLTPVFAARWAMFIGMAASSPLVLAMMLLLMGFAAVSMIRWTVAGTLPVMSESPSRSGSLIMVGILSGLVILVGLLSPLLLEYLLNLVLG